MIKLGQHFLKSKNVVDKIIETAEIKPSDTILEIGPGRGVLTEELIKGAGKVIAVEKDEELFEFLQQKFENKSNLRLVHDDILSYKLQATSYKLIANIPYYITGAILKKFLSDKNQPSLMVLMVQKEVAQRIIAAPPHMSMLSASVQAYGQPKIVCKIPKGHFSPPPKVDSAILKVENISKDFFKDLDEKKFFELVSKGFSHKRKMLKNNLDISGEELKKIGLSEKARAQELGLDDWKKLYCQIYQ